MRLDPAERKPSREQSNHLPDETRAWGKADRPGPSRVGVISSMGAEAVSQGKARFRIVHLPADAHKLNGD